MEMSLALLKDLALSTVVSMSLVGGAYFILDGQNDDIREGLGVLSSRTAVVESRLDGVDGRLERIEGRLDRIDAKLNGIESLLRDMVNLLAERQ